MNLLCEMKWNMPQSRETLRSGFLHSFTGEKAGMTYPYVTQLGYDKFEQRTYLSYGNGTETSYSYEPERRRLKNMVATTAKNRKMMDNVYTYDKVNNILQLQNQATPPKSNQMGGQTNYEYQYDDLYRLTSAKGSHLSSNHENSYTLAMEYNSLHNITKKDQLHQFKGLNSDNWSPRNKTTYQYDYEYGEEQPHAPIQIGDKTYSYDANGNQTGWVSNTSGQQRDILWDEENRIKAIADNGQLFSYVYDASGERVLKSNGGGQSVRLNGAVATNNTGGIGNFTVYVNPYVVVRSSQVTKHFYIESQRVVTKLVESNEGLLQGKAGGKNTKEVNYNTKQNKLTGSVTKNYNDLGLELTPVDDITSNGNAYAYGHDKPNGNGNAYAYGHENGNNGNAYGHENGNNGNGGNNGNAGGNGNGNNGGGSGGNGNGIEGLVYFYHPDHLGSSSYITDANGEVSQHLEYFAFGETFVEEHSNKDRTPYLYNAKELDEETGLYYYGARYYDPVTSVWQSVDPPMLDGRYLDNNEMKSRNLAVYSYTHNNPINLNDPTGECPPGVDCSNPLDKIDIVSPGASGKRGGMFGYTRNFGKKFHSGIDLRASKGTNLKAPLSGKVVYARNNHKSDEYSGRRRKGVSKYPTTGYGNSTVLEYEIENDFIIKGKSKQVDLKRCQKVYIRFTHMDKVDESLEGKHVEMGDILGTTGATGNPGIHDNVWGLKDHNNRHTHMEVSTGINSSGALDKPGMIDAKVFIKTQIDNNGEVNK